MRLHRLVALAVLCTAPASADVKRRPITCDKVSFTELKPGWGTIPAALQKLPPKATLCGVNRANVAFILSALDLGELQKFYAPLFASVGCKPLDRKTGEFKKEKLQCAKGGDPYGGGVETQTDQAYTLYFGG